MNEAYILERLVGVFHDASFALDFALDRDVALEEIDGFDSVSRLRFMLSVEQAFTIEVCRCGDRFARIERSTQILA
jgi:acyl carrier protein